MINVGLESQQQIRGGDGNILWSGGQVVATSYMAISTEVSVGILQGEAVLWDAGNPAAPTTGTSRGVIPRSETTVAPATPAADLPQSLALYCKRTPASAGTGVCFMGVAQDPIGPNPLTATKPEAGKRGVIAGHGSLVSCLVTTAAVPIGSAVVSSATAGKCVAAATKAATVPAYGTVLGICFKTNDTAANFASATGSADWIGLLVAQA